MGVHPTWVIDTLRELTRDPMPLLALIAVVWFASIALAGWVAERRGRNGGNWALLGLLLGPVALASALLLPRRRPTDG